MLLVLNDKNPSTWNNLALTYQKLNESENKILKCYLKALENFNKSENLIIAGNFLNFLNKNKKYSEIIEIYDSLNLNHIENRELFSKNFSIQEIYLRALRKLNKFDDYIKVAKDLYNITTDKTNRVFILNDLVFVYSTDLYSYDMIIKYSTELENCISSVENKEIQMKILNNVIFSKLETDQFISHDKLNYFRSHLDRNPFYNATYGLFCLKNKNIQKGVNLYNKAIGFAYSEDLKDKLRVKKNLEIGKAYISLNSFQTAKYYLEKVIKNTKYSYYKDQAERIISENIIK